YAGAPLLSADLPDRRAFPVADAVELLDVDEAAVDPEPRKLRDDVAVHVVIARAGGPLVIDGLALANQPRSSREPGDSGVHRLAVALVDGSHRVADHRAGHVVGRLE